MAHCSKGFPFLWSCPYHPELPVASDVAFLLAPPADHLPLVAPLAQHLPPESFSCCLLFSTESFLVPSCTSIFSSRSSTFCITSCWASLSTLLHPIVGMMSSTIWSKVSMLPTFVGCRSEVVSYNSYSLTKGTSYRFQGVTCNTDKIKEYVTFSVEVNGRLIMCLSYVHFQSISYSHF